MGNEQELSVVVRARDQATATLRKVKSEVEKAGDAFKSSAQTMKKEFDKAGETLISVGDTFSTVGRKITTHVGLPLLAAGGYAVKSAADMEQWRIAFETMLGSADKANKLLTDIKSFAAKTPFNVTELVEGAKRLLAYNIEAEKILPTLNALGNISAGVGKDKLPQLILALGQVRAAGKLTGAELRQFTEAGVPLLELLAKQAGVSAADIKQAMEDGAAPSFAEVEKAIFSASEEGGKFHNLMQKQSETTAGKFSNLQDKFQETARSIGEKLLPQANKFMEELNKMLDRFNQLSPETQGAIIKISAALIALGPVLSIVGNLIKAWGYLSKAFVLIKGAAIAVGAAIGAISLPVLAIIAAIAAVIAIGVLLWKNWDWVKQKATEVWAWMGTVWEGIKTSITTAISNVATWLSTTWTNITTGISNFITGAINWFKQLPENVAYALGWLIGRFIRFLIEDLPNFIGGVIDWFSKLPGRIGDWLSRTWDAVSGWFVRMWHSAVDLAGRLINNVTDWFSALPGRVAHWVSNMWNRAVGIFNDLRHTIPRVVGDMVGDVVSWFRGLPGKIYDAISGLAGELWNKAKNIGGRFWQGIKDGLGIHSPSYVEKAFMAISAQAEQTTKDMQGAVRDLNHLPSSIKQVPGGQVEVGSLSRAPISRTVTPVEEPRTPVQASAPAPEIHLHVGTFLGTDTELRRYAVEIAKLAQQAMKAQDTTNIEMVRG